MEGLARFFQVDLLESRGGFAFLVQNRRVRAAQIDGVGIVLCLNSVCLDRIVLITGLLGQVQLDIGGKSCAIFQMLNCTRQSFPQGAVAVVPGLGDRQVHTAQAAVGDGVEGLSRQFESLLIRSLVPVVQGFVLIGFGCSIIWQSRLIILRVCLSSNLIRPHGYLVDIRLFSLRGGHRRLQNVDIINIAWGSIFIKA